MTNSFAIIYEKCESSVILTVLLRKMVIYHVCRRPQNPEGVTRPQAGVKRSETPAIHRPIRRTPKG